ncbi:MAG: uroporphyrinogen decarboxylase [Opitutales bacterium]
MTLTPRQRLLDALHCRPVDRPPVWIMRQAGRYLPEYRALKERYSFLELVKSPELAAEVTLQPLRRFGLDSAILFSDILVIPEAVGQPYHFRDQGGIGMDFALADDPSRIAGLSADGIRDKLTYVAEAIRVTRQQLGEDVALLGFGGSPWTLAAYMIEGGSSTHWARAKALAFERPDLFRNLCNVLVDATADYLAMQAEAGVDAIQIFDSWGAALPADVYADVSLDPIRRIMRRLEGVCPVIVYAKGMTAFAETLAGFGARCIAADWTADLPGLRDRLPADVSVQGNLDPVLLSTQPDLVTRATDRLLRAMGDRSGHIVNLGHGILPDAKIACVEALIRRVAGENQPTLPTATAEA